MGEEDSKAEVFEEVTDGSSSKEDVSQVESEKQREENGVKDKEESTKIEETVATEEAEKMDEDKEVKEEEDMELDKKEEEGADVVGEREEVNEYEKKGGKEEDIGHTVSEEKMDKKRRGKRGNEDAAVGGEKNEESKEFKEVNEEVNKMEEVKEEATESQRMKGKRRNSTSKGPGEKAASRATKVVKEPEQRTPAAIERPVRERKSVERLVASIEIDTSKEFHIEKGRGTPLKDIPNVAYKLSRRKSEDTFKLLHTVLFGRRGKAVQIKNNLSQFSGFVWHNNEEKQRLKVKEKLDKCVKEKIMELCDILDIPISKATTKKEDIVVKLLDFLVAPYATTTVLLAEKGKGKKRKRDAKGSASVCSHKSRKKSEDASKAEEKKSTPDSEDDTEEEKEEMDGKKEENGVRGSEDEKSEHSESKGEDDESQDEPGDNADKAKEVAKKESAKKEAAGKAKTNKIAISRKSNATSRTPKMSSKAEEGSDASPKVFSRKKKKNEETTKKKSSTSKRSSSKDNSGKKTVKGKEKIKEKIVRPTDDELRNATFDILKEVDFNTATFTDILKQLAKQFNTDLTPRKSSIKLIIQEELTKLADEDDEEDGDNDDAEKEKVLPEPPAAAEVKA